MRVVLAPDSYKESLTAAEVCDLIEAGFREVHPDWEFVHAPVADGGEGTVLALITATNGSIVDQRVTGPSGSPVTAFFGLDGDGDVAFIEVAAACGLALVPPGERRPMDATSFGVGELILAALDKGARRFVIGLGGSATVDGGAGMLQALGVSLFDAEDHPISSGGGGLGTLAKIDTKGIDPRILQSDFQIAYDVDTVLCGRSGAAVVFGPQKGATPAQVRALENNLSHFADIVASGLGIDVTSLEGGGAAGGMGAGFFAFLGATLSPGSEVVAKAMGLEDLIAECDLVIVGEGCLDGQSAAGKAPVSVAKLARKNSRPVIALAGSLGAGSAELKACGLDAVFGAVSRPCSLAEALDDAATNVKTVARSIAATLLIGMSF